MTGVCVTHVAMLSPHRRKAVAMVVRTRRSSRAMARVSSRVETDEVRPLSIGAHATAHAGSLRSEQRASLAATIG